MRLLLAINRRALAIDISLGTWEDGDEGTEVHELASDTEIDDNSATEVGARTGFTPNR